MEDCSKLDLLCFYLNLITIFIEDYRKFHEVKVWEDESISFYPLENDYFVGDNASLVGFSQPDYGSLLRDENLLRYTPIKDFTGNDSFLDVLERFVGAFEEQWWDEDGGGGGKGRRLVEVLSSRVVVVEGKEEDWCRFWLVLGGSGDALSVGLNESRIGGSGMDIRSKARVS
ncbi:BnaC05g50960D [Brassica napus]|uniref:(rape) hypothetical protein n=1 Tax=Brassica napus TaxID=3708 RepID=A0A078INR2_BRANA|nr:unnamed protein product [Brassica napus]CDY50733.1 BnaC05g50960D [Brassica napus]